MMSFGGSAWRFRLSLAVSAVVQCVCLVWLWLLLASLPLRPLPPDYTAVSVLPVPHHRYRPRLESNLPALKVGGLTGRPREWWRARSHPRLPRAATSQASPEVTAPGNLPDLPFTSDPLKFEAAEPRLPIRTGVFSDVRYEPGRVPRARRIEVGGFTAAVAFEEIAAAGLTSRNRAPDTADCGDGVGKGGGQVLIPARVIWKPKPAYTERAHDHKIEGEVIVDAEFHADGTVRVRAFERRIGYGLDETAVQAVEEIKFKPATVNGRPVDVSARVHVEFRLSQALDEGERRRLTLRLFK